MQATTNNDDIRRFVTCLAVYTGVAETVTLMKYFGNRSAQRNRMDNMKTNRKIPLEGLSNFRDLGGYEAGDGRSVK